MNLLLIFTSRGRMLNFDGITLIYSTKKHHKKDLVLTFTVEKWRCDKKVAEHLKIPSYFYSK